MHCTFNARTYSCKLLSIRIYWNKFPVYGFLHVFHLHATRPPLSLVHHRAGALVHFQLARTFFSNWRKNKENRNYSGDWSAWQCERYVLARLYEASRARDRLNNIWIMCATYTFLINLSFRLSSILNCYCCEFWFVCLCPVHSLPRMQCAYHIALCAMCVVYRSRRTIFHIFRVCRVCSLLFFFRLLFFPLSL